MLSLLLMTCRKACLSPRPYRDPAQGEGVEGRQGWWGPWKRQQLENQAPHVAVCRGATPQSPAPSLHPLPPLPRGKVILFPKLWQILLAPCPDPRGTYRFRAHRPLHLWAPAALPGSLPCPLSRWALLGHEHHPPARSGSHQGALMGRRATVRPPAGSHPSHRLPVPASPLHTLTWASWGHLPRNPLVCKSLSHPN